MDVYEIGDTDVVPFFVLIKIIAIAVVTKPITKAAMAPWMA
jgi:hypothetical protein